MNLKTHDIYKEAQREISDRFWDNVFNDFVKAIEDKEMNGKKCKVFRRIAERTTKGMTKEETRKLYKSLKRASKNH